MKKQILARRHMDMGIKNYWSTICLSTSFSHSPTQEPDNFIEFSNISGTQGIGLIGWSYFVATCL